MKNIIAALVTIILTACGTASSVRVGVAPYENVTFDFVDSRPLKERPSQTVDSPVGLTSWFGDDKLIPAPPDLFKSYMAAKIGDVLTGKTVTLTAFRVTAANPNASLDATRLQMAGGSVPNANPVGLLLAAPVILGIESIKGEKMVIVDIRGNVSGQEFSSICSDFFRGRTTEDNIRSVMLSCLDAAAGKIKKRISG